MRENPPYILAHHHSCSCPRRAQCALEAIGRKGTCSAQNTRSACEIRAVHPTRACLIYASRSVQKNIFFSFLYSGYY